MIKMSEQQEFVIVPSPLELHGDEVAFEMSAKVPVKMLKKGKVYTVNTFYEYAGKEYAFDGIDFTREQYPDYDTVEPQTSANFSMPYDEEMKSGTLAIQGVAANPSNGKEKVSERFDIAQGVITTSRLFERVVYAAYAPHGYNNQEELVPTNVDFYFLQGSSVLRTSEKRSDRGKGFDAFLAEKNVTRTVTITGTHSPEGAERVNSRLSQDRAEAIQKYYDSQMRKYDYQDMADQINFILKPVVEDWQEFKAYLADYEGISDQDKAEIRNITDGSGSFEEKEDQLHKLASYSKVFRDIYPKLRTAQTEVLTVLDKKSDAEIAALARQISNGSVSSDTLNDQELGYAATLTPSLSEKEQIYLAATKKNDSWNSHNNLGAVYMEMAIKDRDWDMVAKAETQFDIANRKKENPYSHTNLAAIYFAQGNIAKADESIQKAVSMSPSNELTAEINGVKGVIEIRQGKYDQALQSLSNAKPTTQNLHNKGLAQLMNHDHVDAIATFAEVDKRDDDSALDHYLSAVSATRLGDYEQGVEHLKRAVAEDSSLKEMAANDLEFLSVRNSPEFIEAMK
jgi:tetratricopeptide (TPR) repeat protein